MKLRDLAARLECQWEGPGDLEITGVAGMDEASPEQITFLANPKYIPKLHRTRAGAIIVGHDIAQGPGPEGPAARLLRSDNPYLAFAKAAEVFNPPYRPPAGIHPTAVIAPDARIGRRASIGAYAVIEESVEIGDDCVLKAHVVIYRRAKIGHRFFAHSHAVVRESVRIGDDVVLQNGAVIGADGFGFAKQSDGSYYKIVQAGTTVLESNVEVQANACIDRAALGETRLGRGVKVDNLVQVGHACEVGENTLLCAQVGLAGTCKVGRKVVLTGQVGAAGHLTIGDNVIVTPQSGIPSDIPANTTVSGSPVMDHARWLKCCAIYPKLPEIYAAFRKFRGSMEKPARRHPGVD